MRLAVPGISEMSRLGKPLRWCGTAIVVACCCAFAFAGDMLRGAAPLENGRRIRTRAQCPRAGRRVVCRYACPASRDHARRTQGVAIMLDRRIDPGSGIELSVHDVSVREVIEQLAAQCGATPAYLDGVVYMGPRSGTAPFGDGGEGAARRGAAVAASRGPATHRRARLAVGRFGGAAQSARRAGAEAGVDARWRRAIAARLVARPGPAGAGVDGSDDTGPGRLRPDLRTGRRRSSGAPGADCPTQTLGVADVSGDLVVSRDSMPSRRCFRRRRSTRMQIASSCWARRKNTNGCNNCCNGRQPAGRRIVRRERRC